MKFSIITLGCKVNTYESQYYAAQLEELGYEQVSPDQACDICIINTCTVTNTAASKSRQKIHYVKRMNQMHYVLLWDVLCSSQVKMKERLWMLIL